MRATADDERVRVGHHVDSDGVHHAATAHGVGGAAGDAVALGPQGQVLGTVGIAPGRHGRRQGITVEVCGDVDGVGAIQSIVVDVPVSDTWLSPGPAPHGVLVGGMPKDVGRQASARSPMVMTVVLQSWRSAAGLLDLPGLDDHHGLRRVDVSSCTCPPGRCCRRCAPSARCCCRSRSRRTGRPEDVDLGGVRQRHTLCRRAGRLDGAANTTVAPSIRRCPCSRCWPCSRRTPGAGA